LKNEKNQPQRAQKTRRKIKIKKKKFNSQ